jgi:hypothetical protein
MFTMLIILVHELRVSFHLFVSDLFHQYFTAFGIQIFVPGDWIQWVGPVDWPHSIDRPRGESTRGYPKAWLHKG